MQDTQLNRISNFLWSVSDDLLRDLYVRGKYRDVILPMTVLRRLDAVLEPTKQKVLKEKQFLDDNGITEQDGVLQQEAGHAFYNTSQFTMRDLAARAAQQSLRADFEAYLDGYSANVQEILDCFEFRNQINRLSQSDVLGALITRFLSPDINLSPYPGQERRRIRQIAQLGQPRHGHHLRGPRTPFQRGKQRGSRRTLDTTRRRRTHGSAGVSAHR